MEKMKRKAFSELIGVGWDTLLVWEEAGLIRPQRDKSDHRLYGEECLERCRFIQAAQGIGFTLEKIKHVFEYTETDHAKEFIRLEAIVRLEELVKQKDQIKKSIAIVDGIIRICEGDSNCKCEFMDYLFKSMAVTASFAVIEGGKA